MQAQDGSKRLKVLVWRAGSAEAVLAALSELPLLTFLDFTSQNLYGALPGNVTFPKLEYLGLRHNQLQARLIAPPLPFLTSDASARLLQQGSRQLGEGWPGKALQCLNPDSF